MAAATVSKQEVFPIAGPGERYVEYVQISNLGAATPGTFTSKLKTIEHVVVGPGGGTPFTTSWTASGSTVTINYGAGGATQPCSVTCFGRRE